MSVQLSVSFPDDDFDRMMDYFEWDSVSEARAGIKELINERVVPDEQEVNGS